MPKGIAGHQRAYQGRSDEWLTPPELLKALGQFDLDPCSPIQRPWSTATNHFTIVDDGLTKQWLGRVWLNPPYGPELGKWLKRLAKHGNGIALVFARTETKAFHDWVWPKASSMLFVRGRLHFFTVDGVRSKHNAGAPSVLIAYGDANTTALAFSGIKGKLVELNNRCSSIVIA